MSEVICLYYGAVFSWAIWDSALVTKRKEELLNIFNLFPKFGGKDKEKAVLLPNSEPGRLYKVLDTRCDY